MSFRLYRKYFLLLGAFFVFFIISIIYFNNNLWNRNVELEEPNQRFLIRNMANRYFNKAQFNALPNITKEDENIYKQDYIKKVFLIENNN